MSYAALSFRRVRRRSLRDRPAGDPLAAQDSRRGRARSAPCARRDRCALRRLGVGQITELVLGQAGDKRAEVGVLEDVHVRALSMQESRAPVRSA